MQLTQYLNANIICTHTPKLPCYYYCFYFARKGSRIRYFPSNFRMFQLRFIVFCATLLSLVAGQCEVSVKNVGVVSVLHIIVGVNKIIGGQTSF